MNSPCDIVMSTLHPPVPSIGYNFFYVRMNYIIIV